MLKRFDLTDFARDYISALAEAHGVDENTFLEMMVRDHLFMSLRELDEKSGQGDLSDHEMRLLTVLDDLDDRLLAQTAEYQSENEIIRLHS